MVVAAMGGVRRGKLRGRKEAALENFKKREKLGEERKKQELIYEAEQKNVEAIMKAHDTDQSGFIEKNELFKLLGDLNLSKLGRNETPTEDDLQCLICLCDEDADGRISKTEVADACRTWFAYMQHAEKTRAALEKFDLSGTGKINHGELRPLLMEMNSGEDIPDEVLKWIWQQADLTGDGSLSPIELTRAIAVWYAWLPDEKAETPSIAELRRNIDADAMPEQPQKSEEPPQKSEEPPQKKKSSTCAVL